MPRERPAAARRILIAVLAALLVLGVVACGGQEIRADEVPGPPPDLPLPAGGEALGGDATPTPTPTTTPTPEGAAAQDGASATPEAPAAGTRTEDAAAAAKAEEPESSDTAQYEEFCAENPGAC